MEQWGYSEISSSWSSLPLLGWSDNGGDGVLRAGNPGCPEELEWWSEGCLAEAGAVDGIWSMWGGSVRGGHLDFPLLLELFLPPVPPKAVWKPVDKKTNIVPCNIEQRRDLRANI